MTTSVSSKAQKNINEQTDILKYKADVQFIIKLKRITKRVRICDNQY